MRDYVLVESNYSDKVGANTDLVYVLNKHQETYKSRKLPNL